jgi:hypothetical protein
MTATKDPVFVNYLLTNGPLIVARDQFFSAVTVALSDALRRGPVEHLTNLDDCPGHDIAESEIVRDSRYGWMAIKENERRHFRLSLWQAGTKLRVGIRVDASFLVRDTPLDSMLQDVFPGALPHRVIRGDGVMYDWHFDVPNLYTEILEQETYILSIVNLYENVYHLFHRSHF